MRQQVFFIHGGSAYSRYDDFLQDLRTMPIRTLPDTEPIKKWTDTLKTDLGEAFEVFTPAMPNKQNAKYLEWKIWFERHFELLRDDIILIGWSQGGYFLVKYLLENDPPVKIKALMLIAAPFEPADFGGEDGGDFAFDTTQTSLLESKVGSIMLFHSMDDFVVPFSHAEKYKMALPKADLIAFTGHNHFLLPDFPELIERVRRFSH